MAIREFSLGPAGGLRSAAASQLPNLVVIAGPNGVGKSTLLYQLYRHHPFREPGTRVTYVGPHRGWRKTALGGAVLAEFQPGFRSYLEQETIPNWTQYQPRSLRAIEVGSARDPAAQEEVFSFVKASILKLEQRQQVALRSVWERQGHRVEPDDVPLLLEPLSRLVRSFLPHLELEEIDISREDNFRVLFRRVDGTEDNRVEIDDLSSGEKSIIGLMLPLVEAEVDTMLGELPAANVLATFVVDEPETHLHASLQVLLIEQLSELASRDRLQSIIATQSPTIVDALDDDSLFLLAPIETVSSGNQLIPIGRMQPKLELMRSLTGSTHLLTRCRPIVFIEGERPPARPVSDQKLIEILIPEATGWVLVASGGRGTASRAARQLREAAAESLPGVQVFALVDADQHLSSDEDHVITWPVAMIENLLLDHRAIWEVLAPHREELALASSAEVKRELDAIAVEMEQDEVRLRVPALQRPLSVRVRAPTLADAAAGVSDARTEMNAVLDQLQGDLETGFAAANEAVRIIVREGRQLEAYRGKQILETFYERVAKRAFPGYKSFAYAVAREARQHERLGRLVSKTVVRVDWFVPQLLCDLLGSITEELGEGTAKEQVTAARDAVTAARRSWEAGEKPSADYEDLRRAVARIARLLPDGDERAQELLAASGQLGVRSSTASSDPP